MRLGFVHAAAGLAASLAVALTLANTSPADPPMVVGPFYDPDRLGVWLEERAFGRRTLVFMLARSRIYEDAPDGPRLIEPRPQHASPRWSTDWSRRIPAMQASGTPIDPTQTYEHAVGWPVPCLASSEYLVERPGGTVAQNSEHAARVAGLAVPTRVWAPGLAINTLVLGVPASGAALLMMLARAAARRKRGLCPVCGYPSDDEIGVCPECGREDVGWDARAAA